MTIQFLIPGNQEDPNGNALECYEIWSPKFFAAMGKISKLLPKVKLHV